MWIDTPQLSPLLDQIDARSNPTDEGEPTESNLDTLYAQLGRLVHAQLRCEHLFATPQALQETRDPTAEVARRMDIDALEDLGEEDWYSDEVPHPEVPFFNPGELEDIDHEPDTEEVDRIAFLPTVTRTVVPTQPMLLLPAFAKQQQVSGTDLHALHEDQVTWKDTLTGLIDWQHDTMTPQARSAQLQWICSDIDIRMFQLPKTIQAAVIGWLAASLHAVTTEIADATGPRLALDRLGRYRTQANLAPLIALTDSPSPEKRSWQSDAKAWQALLTPQESPVEP